MASSDGSILVENMEDNVSKTSITSEPLLKDRLNWPRLVLFLTICETCALGVLYAAENLAPQEVVAYAIGQVLFVYGFFYLFKLCDRTGCLVILLVTLVTPQLIFMMFIAYKALRSIPAQLHNYHKYCDAVDIRSVDCFGTAFRLVYSTLFFAGCEVYAAFFIFAVYQAIKQQLKKPMK